MWCVPDHSDVGILGQSVPPVALGVIDEGTTSAALHTGVAVQAGDIVLAKPQFGAFQATELETILRARGIDTVVIRSMRQKIAMLVHRAALHQRLRPDQPERFLQSRRTIDDGE